MSKVRKRKKSKCWIEKFPSNFFSTKIDKRNRKGFSKFSTAVPDSCKTVIPLTSFMDIQHVNMWVLNFNEFFSKFFPWSAMDHRWIIAGLLAQDSTQGWSCVSQPCNYYRKNLECFLITHLVQSQLKICRKTVSFKERFLNHCIHTILYHWVWTSLTDVNFDKKVKRLPVKTAERKNSFLIAYLPKQKLHPERFHSQPITSKLEASWIWDFPCYHLNVFWLLGDGWNSLFLKQL